MLTVKLNYTENTTKVPHIVLTISKVASKLNTVAAIVEEMNGQWSLLKIEYFSTEQRKLPNTKLFPSKDKNRTRIHSSRMRTVRCSGHLVGVRVVCPEGSVSQLVMGKTPSCGQTDTYKTLHSRNYCCGR